MSNILKLVLAVLLSSIFFADTRAQEVISQPSGIYQGVMADTGNGTVSLTSLEERLDRFQSGTDRAYSLPGYTDVGNMIAAAIEDLATTNELGEIAIEPKFDAYTNQWHAAFTNHIGITNSNPHGITTAMIGAAGTGEVVSAIAAAIAPLATTAQLAQVQASIPSTNGLASTSYVAAVVAPLASTTQLADAVATLVRTSAYFNVTTGGSVRATDFKLVSGGVTTQVPVSVSANGETNYADAAGNIDLGTIGGTSSSIVTGQAIIVGTENALTPTYGYVFGTRCGVTGLNSVAMGYRASAIHANSFVWSDASSESAFNSANSNTFNVRAKNGFIFSQDSNVLRFTNAMLSLNGIQFVPGYWWETSAAGPIDMAQFAITNVSQIVSKYSATAAGEDLTLSGARGGTPYFGGRVIISGGYNHMGSVMADILLRSPTTAEQGLTVSSTLTVRGSASIASNLVVSNGVAIGGTATIGGPLTVTNTAIFKNNMSIASNLTVTGKTTMAGGFEITLAQPPGWSGYIKHDNWETVFMAPRYECYSQGVFKFMGPAEWGWTEDQTNLYVSGSGVRVFPTLYARSAMLAGTLDMTGNAITNAGTLTVSNVTLGGVSRSNWPVASSGPVSNIVAQSTASTWDPATGTLGLNTNDASASGGGITNGQTGVTLAGTFSGYGSGLTNVADSTARASITAMGDAIHSRILATVTNGTATLWASSSAWYRVNCDTNALTNWVIDTTGVSAGDTVAMAVEIYRPNANTWAWMPGVTNASPATNATTLNFFVLISGATNWLVNP